MNLHTFVPPFDGFYREGKKQRTLKGFRNSAGVYLIKEDGVIVYVGMSKSCVVKALYRHFYFWEDFFCGYATKAYRTTYYDKQEDHNYSVAILELNKEQVDAIERTLIITLNPRDNREKYESYIENLIINKQAPSEEDMPF